jgi:hypothetical protein
VISVGEKIREAIDWMGRGNMAQALGAVSIAVDMTSRRHAGSERSGHAIRRRFVHDYLWLIARLGFPAWPPAAARNPVTPGEAKSGGAAAADVEEIVDHVIRCGLSRSDGRASKIAWRRAIAVGRDEEGNLVLNEGLFWGLVSAVVFAPVNRLESIPDEYWLQVGPFRMFISELWGREDLARRMIRFHRSASVP